MRLAAGGAGRARPRTARSRSTAAALEIGTVYVTLSALSWDPHDWNWKLNHDTGLFYEQLFAGRPLQEQEGAAASIHFVADAWLPTDAIRGELAEKLGVEGEPAARRDQAAQGRDVPREARRHEEPRARRRGRGLQLQPPEHEPQASCKGYFDHVDKVEAPDSAHRRLLHEALLRRMGLPLRLGLLLGDLSQGGGRRRRQQLEERQRHRPLTC